MKTHDGIAAFAREHAFDLRALAVEERDAICCVLDCHKAINDGYARLPQAVLVQAERQERQWRKVAEQLQGEEKSVYLAACDYRMQGVTAMKSFVGMLSAELVLLEALLWHPPPGMQG
jgi:hypothetical protein